MLKSNLSERMPQRSLQTGDYCWGDLLRPYLVDAVDGDRVSLVGFDTPMKMSRIKGWVRPDDPVAWLPLSNNWQSAIVLDKPELWIRVKKSGFDVHVHDCRYLARRLCCFEE